MSTGCLCLPKCRQDAPAFDRVQNETEVRKDETKTFKVQVHSGWLASSKVASWVQYGLMAGLAAVTLLAAWSLQPATSRADVSSLETPASPSPTPAQVTPPPTGSATDQLLLGSPKEQSNSAGDESNWLQNRDWLLPFAGGIILWAAGSIALVSLAALTFWYLRRRGKPAPAPPSIPSVPFLDSADSSLYFRLERLDGDGLIIGRGKQGVDFRIEENVPHADTVSNRHARIYYDAVSGHVLIQDLDSTNGIFINGRQAPRKNLLKDGWVVRLGSVTLTYHDGDSDTGPLE
jgi:hypothetical protein